MSCLDEETIAAFVESRLPPGGIATLEVHVRDCSSCRELVSLAFAASPGQSTIAGPDDAVGTATVASSSPAPSEALGLARGTSVGRYTVLGLIGRGGMAEVHAAYDPELDRRIALKILHSDLDPIDGRGVDRLLREAKAIAKLRHPNVVVVHDAGRYGGQVFIAMECVDGQTLGAWLAERPRTQREILGAFLAAGRGLQAAHAAGLVHHDFKPQNVMVGGDGDVRVMDFGLARVIDVPVDPSEDSGEAAGMAGLDPSLIRTGELLGTPLYMSAEQFAGKPADARSDQFSFCVALYQALYGAHPFGGQQPLAQLRVAVTEGRMQPPPATSAVAKWLRQILLRGLAPSPDRRYPSMSELLASLERGPAARRRRWLALGAVVLLLAGVAVGSNKLSVKRATCDGSASRGESAWSPTRRAAVERAFLGTGSKRAATAFARTAALLDEYVARWRGLYRESCEATHVRGEQSVEVLDLRMACLDERLASVRALADTFAAPDADVVGKAPGAVTSLPALDRCSDVAALRAIVRPPDDPTIRRKVGELRERLAAVDALSSARRCEPATRLGRPLLGTAKQLGYLPLQAEASFALGRMFDGCLGTDEALAHLEDAVMSAEAARYDEVAIEAAATLASAYAERTHDVRAARSWLRLAEAGLARFPGHPRLEARVTMSRGVVLYREGRLEEALQQGRRALALREVLSGSSSFEVGGAANNIANALHDLGRDDEAESSIRRAREITRETLGDDSGVFALVSLNESEILTSLGRFQAAHAAIDRAIEIYERGEPNGFWTACGLLYRGRLELAERRPSDAVATLERSLALLADKDPRYAAEARFALARALVDASPHGLARAGGLARRARAALGTDPTEARLVRDIERWQREHPMP